MRLLGERGRDHLPTAPHPHPETVLGSHSGLGCAWHCVSLCVHEGPTYQVGERLPDKARHWSSQETFIEQLLCSSCHIP